MMVVNVIQDANVGKIYSIIVVLMSVIPLSANGIKVSVLSLSLVMIVSMCKDLISDNLHYSLMLFYSMT
jgi:hypothetical protein